MRELTPELDTRSIPLTKGYSAIVDADDFEWLSRHRWFAAVREQGVYAVRHRSRKDGRGVILMHREIVAASPGEYVDHINHSGLDNRRTNLRKCNQPENSANARAQLGRTSKFKGVAWYKPYLKWRAYISPNGRFTHLGYFDDEEEAALAYNAAAKAHFGQFSHLNSISR